MNIKHLGKNMEVKLERVEALEVNLLLERQARQATELSLLQQQIELKRKDLEQTVEQKNSLIQALKTKYSIDPSASLEFNPVTLSLNVKVP